MTVTTETIATTDLEFARQLGQQLRVDSIRCSTAAGSGHPTSSMSAADLIAVLLSRYLQYDWSKPKDPSNDHLIYSKGHASPLCYAMFKAAGAISDEELLTYRKFGSRLQGHPTPAIPWVDVARGCRSRSGWRWPAATWTSSRTTSGRCAAIRRWPRARSGRASTRPATTGS